MNVLLDTFPEFVTVSGKDYPIYTDFRNWIKFFSLHESENISQKTKIAASFQWFKEEPPPPEQAEEALNALIAFALMQEENETFSGKSGNSSTTRKILSWEYDSAYIYAAFLSVYHLDLRKEKMHWHLFLKLFEALPEETPIKKRMSYRAINLSEIKDKAERKRIRKIQQQIKIPQSPLSAMQTGDFFG